MVPKVNFLLRIDLSCGADYVMLGRETWQNSIRSNDATKKYYSFYWSGSGSKNECGCLRQQKEEI